MRVSAAMTPNEPLQPTRAGQPDNGNWRRAARAAERRR
jgi:hypothetical protein